MCAPPLFRNRVWCAKYPSSLPLCMRFPGCEAWFCYPHLLALILLKRTTALADRCFPELGFGLKSLGLCNTFCVYCSNTCCNVDKKRQTCVLWKALFTSRCDFGSITFFSPDKCCFLFFGEILSFGSIFVTISFICFGPLRLLGTFLAVYSRIEFIQ